MRVTSDGRLDASHVRCNGSERQAQVRLLDLPGFELRHQARLGQIVLGNHQQAARVAVQSVDDPGAHHPGDAAVRRVAGQQGVHQSAARVARRRMDHEPGRLVDDEHVVVFVDDRERYGFGFQLERDRIRDLELYDFARQHLLIRLDR